MAEAKTIQSLNDIELDISNVNTGTDRGSEMLDWSITNLHFGRSIVVDRGGRVIAGNQVTKYALKKGAKIRVIPTTGDDLIVHQRVDLDLNGDGQAREQARLLAISDNRVSEVNYHADAEMLLTHQASGIDLAPMYDAGEIAALMDSLIPQGEKPEPGAGGDEWDSEAETAQKRVQLGDTWIIAGRHKLYCGDCTNPQEVAELLRGERIGLLATDPPYGVSYVAKARDMHRLGYVHSQASTDLDIDSDELSGPELTDFLVKAIGAGMEYADEKCALYVWHQDARRREFMAALDLMDVFVHQIIIWLKPGFVIGRCNYHHRFEPCFHGWPKGARPDFNGERNQSNVWELGRENDKIHPTQKPVELFSIPIRNHVKSGEICYEPFAGSGTQIIAAHRENVRCFAMEIEPTYCDRILARCEAEGMPVVLAERAAAVAS